MENPVFRVFEIKDQKFCHTQIHLTSTLEINWTVRNLNSLPKDASYKLESLSFDFQNATWCLRLYPNYKTAQKRPFIGMTIVRWRSSVPRHRLQYHLKSLDTDKTVWKTADFDENHKERGDMEFIALSNIFGTSTARDSFDVVCQVSCCGSHGRDAFSQTEFSTRDTKDVGTLCQNFKTMLLDGQDHDLVLRVKDQEFRAHQNILRARSPVLESMLSHDMIEKNSGVVDIPDCDPGAFRQFLFYLYGGEVETLDVGNMLPLYYIADKYDAGHLKEVCRGFIRESLSTGNVTDVVQTALDHSDADLLRWSTNYFVREVDEILPTVQWLSFMKRNAVQANELVIKATKNKNDLIKMAAKT